eukprot:PLAT3322.4.p1 GENE.PLAT3322.4~~PLAT3322.4.p1  ORF type:complete len:2017 (-),score=886.30 PLAT3322.4:81-5990(-)
MLEHKLSMNASAYDLPPVRFQLRASLRSNSSLSLIDGICREQRLSPATIGTYDSQAPTITALVAEDASCDNDYANGDQLHVFFNRPTDRAGYSTLTMLQSEVDAELSFSLPIGAAYTAQWWADDRLVVTVSDITGSFRGNASMWNPLLPDHLVLADLVVSTIGSIRTANATLQDAQSAPSRELSPPLVGTFATAPKIIGFIASAGGDDNVYGPEDTIELTWHIPTDRFATWEGGNGSQLLGGDDALNDVFEWTQDLGNNLTASWNNESTVLTISVLSADGADPPVVGQLRAQIVVPLFDAAGNCSSNEWSPKLIGTFDSGAPAIVKFEGLPGDLCDAGLGAGDRMHIQFDQDTDLAGFAVGAELTKSEFEELFFLDADLGNNFTAQWLTPRLVEISVHSLLGVRLSEQPLVGETTVSVVGGISNALSNVPFSRSQSPAMSGGLNRAPSMDSVLAQDGVGDLVYSNGDSITITFNTNTDEYYVSLSRRRAELLVLSHLCNETLQAAQAALGPGKTVKKPPTALRHTEAADEADDLGMDEGVIDLLASCHTSHNTTKNQTDVQALMPTLPLASNFSNPWARPSKSLLLRLLRFSQSLGRTYSGEWLNSGRQLRITMTNIRGARPPNSDPKPGNFFVSSIMELNDRGGTCGQVPPTQLMRGSFAKAPLIISVEGFDGGCDQEFGALDYVVITFDGPTNKAAGPAFLPNRAAVDDVFIPSDDFALDYSGHWSSDGSQFTITVLDVGDVEDPLGVFFTTDGVIQDVNNASIHVTAYTDALSEANSLFTTVKFEATNVTAVPGPPDGRYAAGDRILIEFSLDADVQAGDSLSTAEVDALLVPSLPLGTSYTGLWLTERELELTVVDETGSNIAVQHSGLTFNSTTLRESTGRCVLDGSSPEITGTFASAPLIVAFEAMDGGTPERVRPNDYVLIRFSHPTDRAGLGVNMTRAEIDELLTLQVSERGEGVLPYSFGDAYEGRWTEDDSVLNITLLNTGCARPDSVPPACPLWVNDTRFVLDLDIRDASSSSVSSKGLLSPLLSGSFATKPFVQPQAVTMLSPTTLLLDRVFLEVRGSSMKLIGESCNLFRLATDRIERVIDDAGFFCPQTVKLWSGDGRIIEQNRATAVTQEEPDSFRLALESVADDMAGGLFVTVGTNIGGLSERTLVATVGWLEGFEEGTPTIGSADGGDSLVLRGGDFHVNAAGYRCDFVDEAGNNISAPATVLSFNRLNCSTPRWLFPATRTNVSISRFGVSLQIGFCGSACLQSGSLTLLDDAPQFTYLERWSSLRTGLGAGSMRLLLFGGVGFDRSKTAYFCEVFNGKYTQRSPIVAPVTSTLVACPVPPWPYTPVNVRARLWRTDRPAEPVQQTIRSPPISFREPCAAEPRHEAAYLLLLSVQEFLVNNTLGGSFSLQLGALLTPELSSNSTAAQLQDALSLLTDLDVQVQGRSLAGKAAAFFVLLRNVTGSRLPSTALSVASSSLTGDGAMVEVRAVAWQPVRTCAQCLPTLTAGWDHTCSRTSDAFANYECWGSNRHKQLAMNQDEVKEPIGDMQFWQVTAGRSHSCALRQTYQPICWGVDVPALVHKKVPPGDSLVLLSAGAYHTCGIARNGSAVCWGENMYGKARAPGSICRDPQQAATTNIVTKQARNEVTCRSSAVFTDVAAGVSHSCALEARDLSATCFGLNTHGQLGLDRGDELYETGSFGVPGPFTQLVVGLTHSCGLLLDGGVRCWGSDAEGQASPPAGLRAVRLSSGLLHTCAVRLPDASLADGGIVCWGSNTVGQLGPPDGIPARFVEVAAGEYHTCGLVAEDALLLIDVVAGSVLCWGEYSQGKQSTDDFAQPAELGRAVNGLPGVFDIRRASQQAVHLQPRCMVQLVETCEECDGDVLPPKQTERSSLLNSVLTTVIVIIVTVLLRRRSDLKPIEFGGKDHRVGAGDAAVAEMQEAASRRSFKVSMEPAPPPTASAAEIEMALTS